MKRPYLIAAVTLAIAAAGVSIVLMAQGSGGAPLRGFVAGTVAPVAEPPDTGEDPLAHWERFGSSFNYKRTLLQADAVRAVTPRGAPGVVEQLLAIATDKKQGMGSRSVAVSVACDLADAAGAERIIEVMEAYRNGSMAKADLGMEQPPQEVINAHMLLVRGFAQDEIAKLVEVMPNDEAALAFIAHILSATGGQGCGMCYRLLGECEVRSEVGRATALEFVDRARESAWMPEQVLDLLDDAAFPQLRERVRAESTPDRFHFSAAGALAHLGDAEILPDLEARWSAFVEEDPENAGHYNTYFDRWILQIQVQSPPSRLLEYIASVVPDPPARTEHDWAVRRALHHGIDPERIREAILRNHEKAESTYERLTVRTLKREGLRLGILREGDLPDVVDNEPAPTD